MGGIPAGTPAGILGPAINISNVYYAPVPDINVNFITKI